MMIQAMIFERGNGFPKEGDYCVHLASGELYRIVGGLGRLHTDCGSGNYAWGSVEKADWDDLDEGEETHSAAIILGDEADDEDDEE